MKGLKRKENVRSDPQLFMVFMRLTRFCPVFLFYTPWKPLVFCLFRRYKMEILATNGLIYFFSLSLIPSCINADWYLLPSSSVFRKMFVVRKDKVFFTAYFRMPQKYFRNLLYMPVLSPCVAWPPLQHICGYLMWCKNDAGARKRKG